jgi:hypothetical protein
MISYIKRKNLDIEKYNFCIENSIQSNIYGFSWYLDSVADNWDVLVLNDYEAVMPIPWKQNFFLKYVSQPNFCQQLGIFSVAKISDDTQIQFIKNIPLKFLKVTLVLNSHNILIGKHVRKNLFVHLSNSHEIVRKNFSKGRTHAIKVAEKNQLILKETSIQSLIDIQKNSYQYQFSEEKLQKISTTMLQQKRGEIIGVFKDEVLLGGALFVYSKKRMVYLFSSYTKLGRELQASSYLINCMLKKNENSNLIFDFEGGNLPNMATFYNSFGADVETYSLVTRTLL